LRRGCSAHTSPWRGRPSQGSTSSRSAPFVVAASSVRRALHAVSTAARCSADRLHRTLERPCDDFHRFRRPLRVRAAMPSPVQRGPGRPSWGFTPLQRPRPERSARRGFASPATFRPRSFSLPRRFDPSPALRARWARCRSWGFDSKSPLGREGRDTLTCPLRPLDSCATDPRTLTSTRPYAPDSRRCLSPHTLVPWPWSQVSRVPLRSTSSPGRGTGARPHLPLSRFARGVWANHDALSGGSGCFTSPGTGGSARDPQLP